VRRGRRPDCASASYWKKIEKARTQKEQEEESKRHPPRQVARRRLFAYPRDGFTVWTQTCPQCGKVVWKLRLTEAEDCTCGWVWEGSVPPEHATTQEPQATSGSAPEITLQEILRSTRC
jgi:hypothetical protein